MRPANVVTAVADILAGAAIAGYTSLSAENIAAVFWLVLSTAGLYAAGVVFNDLFDAELDSVERPERPIPSGVVLPREAAWLGSLLLIAGVTSAFKSSFVSGVLATFIAIAALVYDRWGKHHSFFGPFNMGLCRGLNLLLGISIVPAMLQQYWWLASVPVLYIASVTMISRGEVHGGSKRTLYAAVGLYILVMGSILCISFVRETFTPATVFILLWAALIFPPLRNAIRNPQGKFIGKAVKVAVLALIVMDAAWAVAFGAFYMALTIILLLPLSVLLAKAFAVT